MDFLKFLALVVVGHWAIGKQIEANKEVISKENDFLRESIQNERDKIASICEEAMKTAPDPTDDELAFERVVEQSLKLPPEQRRRVLNKYTMKHFGVKLPEDCMGLR
jgi:hypothetical protein